MIICCVNCNLDLPIPDVVFKFGIPIISCPKCNTAFRPTIKFDSKDIEATQLVNNVVTKDDVLGWLIVHDAKAPLQVYNLHLDKQHIGRLNKNKPCEIMIDTPDMTMSRNHFYIEVIKTAKETLFFIEGSESSNNTYLNKKLLKFHENKNFILQDNDLIQAGKTQIVFKLKNNLVQTEGQAKTIVKEMSKSNPV